MRKYNEHTLYVIYKYPETDIQYAVSISDVLFIEKHYSDIDKFLYAPDDLFVDGIPISIERKNGMMNFDFENKIKLHVKTLVPAWNTVSDE